MIIRINAKGKVSLVSGAALTQGSSLSNELFFEAPISGAASCNVYFTLPNGAYIGPHYAKFCDTDVSLGINTWHLIIDAAITQYAGELCVHADFMQGKQIVATADCYTTIRRGAYRPSLVLSENSDKYLEAISKAFSDGKNALVNVQNVLGCTSAYTMYAWKYDGHIGYTEQRHPSASQDSIYYFDESGELIESALQIASVARDKFICKSGEAFVYAEEENIVFWDETSAPPIKSILYRLGKLELPPISASEIDEHRGLSDSTAFSGDLAFSSPLTLGNYRYAMRRAAVDAVDTVDAPLSQYKEYYLGLMPFLDLRFPSVALRGDRIYIQWVSGQAPTTLTVDESNTNAIDFEPLPQHVCEIQGVYGIVGYDYENNAVVSGWNLIARQSPLEVS